MVGMFVNLVRGARSGAANPPHFQGDSWWLEGRRVAPLLLMLGALVTAFEAEAATVWIGPRLTFSHADNTNPTQAANQDRLTPGVWITRDTTRGIYNAAKESDYTDGVSPAGTEWAFGTIADRATLMYQTWVDWAKPPPETVGRDAVLHLIAEDIYLDIRFTAWSQMSGGGFAYQRSTPSGGGPTSAPVIEYYHAVFDHYFITRNPDEITKLDNGTFVGWQRTGLSFNVYPTATAGAASVCRFFSTAFDPKSSHFYTPFPVECTTVKANPSWQFEGEGDEVFYIPVASASGTCGSDTTPVYRLYNNGMGNAPNHRYTTSAATRDQMVAAGWVIEGNGPGFAFMCAPS